MKNSLFAILALLIIALPAIAADPEVAEPTNNAAASSQTATPQVDVNQAELANPSSASQNAKVQLFGGEKAAPEAVNRPLSPMMIEIQKVVDADRATNEALIDRQKSALSDGEALNLQREIETLAQNTELKILQIQADFARKDGREEIAKEIEDQIQLMRAPARRGVPMDRSAPVRNN